MKYSFVICYRDRLENLKILVQNLVENIKNIDYEIIVSEQGDTEIFRRGNLRNEGARAASGDVLIFHDVDYVPADASIYFGQSTDVWLPVFAVDFLAKDMAARSIDDTPIGYRHFHTAVDDNFFGGVICIKKESFEKMNGWSTLYRGWGCEDADFGERCKYNGLSIARSTQGRFNALYHPDSGLPLSNPEFQRNQQLLAEFKNHLGWGIKDKHHPTVISITPELLGIDIWLKVTNFDPPPGGAETIQSSILEDI